MFSHLNMPSIAEEQTEENTIQRLKQTYANNTAFHKLTPATKLLSEMLSNIGMEKRLQRELHTAVLEYAKHHLHQIGQGNNYTVENVNNNNSAPTSNTKPTRATAVSILLDLLNNASANDVYQYMLTPKFKELAGGTEYKFNLLRQHFWTACDRFIKGYEQFAKLNTPANVLHVLLDESTRFEIKDNELAILFWHYQPKVVADVIVNLYGDEAFSPTYRVNNDCELSFQTMQRVLKEDKTIIATINQVRCDAKSTLLLPPNTISAGKNALLEEGLTKDELFQYDESTIFAVEQYLRENYRHLLFNKIEPKVALQVNARYFFYQIPAALYMLIHPSNMKDPNYYRYQAFKKDMQGLLESSISITMKPVIFFGIINIDGNHYIPYFIYKNNKQQIQVITIDPSSRLYPEEIVNDKNFIDTKLKTRKKLMVIFEDVFPGCQFSDPDANQMLRERDCGPNSATTLEAALKGATSENALLIINEDDQLVIDEKQLPLNYQPIAIDPYTHKFVYDQGLEIDSRQNREVWKQRLVEMKTIKSMTIRAATSYKEALRIDDRYNENDQIELEFDYENLVNQQQQQDAKWENISTVQQLILSDSTGQALARKLLTQYKESLLFPNANELAGFIKNKIDSEQLKVLTSAHQGDLYALANDVIGLILKDHIPDALRKVFANKILPSLPLTLDADLDSYVNKFIQANLLIYKSLPIQQQRQVKESFKQMAIVTHKERLLTHAMRIAHQIFDGGMRYYLTELNFTGQSDIDQLVTIINNQTAHAFFNNEDPTKIDFLVYLGTNDSRALKNIIKHHLDKLLENMVEASITYIINAAAIETWTLDNLIKRFDRETGRFIPVDVYFIIGLAIYRNEAPNIIDKSEIVSPLGINYILPALQIKFNEVIYAQLKHQLEIAIGQIITDQEFKQKIEDEYGKIANAANVNVPHYGFSLLFDGQNKLNKNCIQPQTIDYLLQQQPILSQKHLAFKFVNFMAQQVIVENIEAVLRTALFKQYEGYIKAFYASACNAHKEIPILKMDNALFNHQPAHFLNHIFKLGNDQPSDIIREFNFRFTEAGFSDKFLHWFATYQYKSLTDLKNRIDVLNGQIEQFNTLLTSNVINHPTNQQIADKLKKMQTQLNELALSQQDPHGDYMALHLEFVNTIVQLAQDISSPKFGFHPGNITPGAATSQMRPLLCNMLGIDTPAVLTAKEAIVIDKKIMQFINEPTFISNPFSSTSKLLALQPIHELPATYGKTLTKQLLLALLGYWFTKESVSSLFGLTTRDCPPLIVTLIKEVNAMGDDDILTENAVSRIGRYLGKNTLELYHAKDTLSQIESAILKTIHYTDTKASSIQFVNVNHLFSGKPLPSAPKPQPLSEEQLSKLTRERMQAIKKEGGKINLMQIRMEIQNNYASSNLNTEIAHVNKEQLKPSKYANLFNWQLTGLEKELVDIKRKHDNQADFYLDANDVELIVKRLKYRWNKLLKANKGDEKLAAKHYLETPDRKDNIYIAMAEMIAKYYQSQGVKEYTYHLLMPTHSGLLAPEALKSHQAPVSITKALGLDDDTSIDDIVLNKLVMTRTGFAFDITWINDQHIKEGLLINPYTGHLFSENEMADILEHPEASILVTRISQKHGSMDMRAIDLLRDYLNGAIFDNGFNHYYDDNQNKKVELAYQHFQIEINKLPAKNRLAFFNETIPGSDSDTLETVFNKSTDSCLTLKGVAKARVVIAYKGDDHGLKSAELVRRAKEIRIERRQAILLEANLVEQSEQQRATDQLEEKILEMVSRKQQAKTENLKKRGFFF